MGQRGRRPNVLLLMTDQQRPDTIGAYGNSQIRTPNVDRLAAGGVLFEQAYCTQPVCSPSRASILTGMYPHTHGVTSNAVPLPAAMPTLAELLRPDGYACGYIGKWHLGRERVPQRGFDDWWVSTEEYGGGYSADDPAAATASSYHAFLAERGYAPVTKGRDASGFGHREFAAQLPEEVGKPAFQAGEAIRFLETFRDRPFFLSVNFLEPHPPYSGPFDDMYDPGQMMLPRSWYKEIEETVPLRYRRRRQLMRETPHGPKGRLPTNDEAGWKALKARYWGNCTLVDKYAGRILDRLEELGLAEHTIVVYTSDHGELMGEHGILNKGLQYEGSVSVPLIVHSPNLVPGRVNRPVSQVHLVPALLELLGRPVPDHVQGDARQLLATDGALDDDAGAGEDGGEVVIEWSGYSTYPNEYERGETPGELRGEPEEIERLLRTVDVRTIRRGRWKLNVHLSGEHELYDLHSDPEELHNAFYDPGNNVVIGVLFDRLRAWQRRTADPLVLPDVRAAVPV
jgi:arylsulfatase